MEKGTRHGAWGSFAGDRQQSHTLSIWGSLEKFLSETSEIAAELLHSKHLSQTLFHQACAKEGEEWSKFIARIQKSKNTKYRSSLQIVQVKFYFFLRAELS